MCYGPGLLFRGPFCIKEIRLVLQGLNWRYKGCQTVSIIMHGYSTCHQRHWYHLLYQRVPDGLKRRLLAYAMNHSCNTMTARLPLSPAALHLSCNKNRSVETSTALLSASNIQVLGCLVINLRIQTRKKDPHHVDGRQISATTVWLPVIVTTTRLVLFIARQQEWPFSYFAVRSANFHRGDNEDGYSSQECDAVKFGRSVSLFGRTVFSPLAICCQLRPRFIIKSWHLSSRLLSAFTSYQLVYC